MRLALAAIPVVILLIGGGLGYKANSMLWRRKIVRYEKAATLGRLLTPAEKREMARAFDDPAEALKSMDQFTWQARSVPAPFVGYLPRPGRQGTAEINALGMRDRRLPQSPKPGGVFRVFLTGGSTAFSTGAAGNGQTVGAYLETCLNESASAGARKYEVFTLAAPGWCSTQERIAIENRLSELQPDLVVSLSGNNDVHWAVQGRDVLWFRSYADQLHWEILDGVFKTAGFGAWPEIAPIAPAAIPPEEVARKLTKNVRLANRALQGSGAGYLFCLQPSLAVTRKPLTERERRKLNAGWKEYFGACYTQIRSELSRLEEEGFRYVDSSVLFDKDAQPEELFLDSYHFAETGNRRLAAFLRDAVLSFPARRR